MMQHHHQHPLLRVVIAMLVIAVIVGLAAYIVTRVANRRARGPMMVAPTGPPMHDAALEQLRLRYARGEVTRTDYLQAATDLGAAPSP
jgi:putative membrane protein